MSICEHCNTTITGEVCQCADATIARLAAEVERLAAGLELAGDSVHRIDQQRQAAERHRYALDTELRATRTELASIRAGAANHRRVAVDFEAENNRLTAERDALKSMLSDCVRMLEIVGVDSIPGDILAAIQPPAQRGEG